MSETKLPSAPQAYTEEFKAFLRAQKGHWWSGFPGGYCLKCGAECAVENAIGMGWYDPFDETWDTPEHQREVTEADGHCPADTQLPEHLKPCPQNTPPSGTGTISSP